MLDTLKSIISKYLRAGTDYADTDPRYVKVRMMSMLVFSGIFLCIAFGIINYGTGDILLAGIETIIAVSLIFVYVFMLKSGNMQQVANYGAIIVVIISGVVFLTGGYENTGIFWIFSFPAIILFLQGIKKGIIYLLIMFVLIGTLAVIGEAGALDYTHTQIQRRFFQISLLFNTSLVFVYQFLQERNFKKLIQQKQQLDSFFRVNRQEKQRLNLILHSIGDGVLVLDRSGRILIINNTACRLAGYSQEELIEHHYSDHIKFIHSKDGSANTEFIESVLKDGRSTTMAKDTVLITRENKEIPVSDSASPILDDKGNVAGCIIVFRDVSKEVEIEKVKDEFISLASHELRTPLTSNQYNLELLEDSLQDGTPEQKNYMQVLKNTNKEMADLVNDLLNVSRIESGRKFTIKPVRSDLLLTITKAISELSPQAQQKEIKVNFDNKGLPEFLADFDAEKMKEVFKNLIVNSIKYSEQKSEVNVLLEHDNDSFKVSVSDSGIGIPLNQQMHIFEKLFRANNAVSGGSEGTGLGLYITKAIIEGHRGRIWFDSTENEGSTFYIELPIKNKLV